MTESNLQDSGQRHTASTGAQTDPGNSLCAMELLSPWALLRLSRHFGAGAAKYAPRNWEKGIPYSVCVGKLLRHLAKWQMGHNDEDHLAAVGFWWHALTHFEETGRWAALDNIHYTDPLSEPKQPVTPTPTASKDEVETEPLNYRLSIYVSHPIRGKTGSSREVSENMERARKAGVILREAFPDVDWYIPAEHDEVVQEMLDQGTVTIENVLVADEYILRRRDGLLALCWCPSKGVDYEIMAAATHKIPFWQVTNMDELVEAARKLLGSL